MLKMIELYPQYQIKSDRRNQNIPVKNDRRSGVDRRAVDRVKLDTNLTRDIFELKNSASQKNVSFTQKMLDVPKISKIQESVKANSYMDKIELSSRTTTKNTPKNHAESATSIGAALAGVFGSLCFGAASAIMGVGVGFYLGCKSLKTAIVSHLKNE